MTKLAVLGAYALVACSTVANATTIYFTGSTAFRAGTVTAIHNIFDAGSLTFGYNGTSETGQNVGVYMGTIGSVAYTIKTEWTGSEAGIQTVADNNGAGQAINFALDTPYVSGSQQALTAGGLQNIEDPTVAGANAAHFESKVPQVDLADTFQATSQFKSGATIQYVDSSNHTFAALTPAVLTSSTFGANLGQGIVGVIPFKCAASKHANFTNVTDQQMRNLYANGFLPRALFSGSASDENVRVYAIGRNNDSGTRLSCLGNFGYGALKSVNDYQPLDGTGALITGTGKTIATIQQWPDDIVNNILQPSPNSGYNSGGKVAGALGSETSSMVSTDGHTGGDLVSYVGISDATTIQNAGGIILNYNGLPYSLTAVAEGQYTLWGYEHLYYSTTTLNTVALQNVVNAIAVSIHDKTPASAGVRVGDMNVTRNGTNKDAQPIVPNYSY